MHRMLGIDYGSKNVGIALSDDSGTLAFPKEVVETEQALDRVVSYIEEYGVEMVVLGRSRDFKGNDNPIMKDIISFKESLEEKTNVTVVFEDEYLTSHQAQHIQGVNDMIDASAAAIILQSYLDKNHE